MSHTRSCHAVAALLLIGALTGCRRPSKPNGVPSTAVTLGGAKKTYYIACDIWSTRIYRCQVYGRSGSTMAEGLFSLEGGGMFEPSDSKEYEGFDGKEIHLTRGRALIVRPPPRPTGLPSAAHWSGGPKCGAFFVCTPADGDSEFRCQTFAERDGTLISDRTYVLHGSWDGGLDELQSCDPGSGGTISIGEDVSPYLAPIR